MSLTTALSDASSVISEATDILLSETHIEPEQLYYFRGEGGFHFTLIDVRMCEKCEDEPLYAVVRYTDNGTVGKLIEADYDLIKQRMERFYDHGQIERVLYTAYGKELRVSGDGIQIV